MHLPAEVYEPLVAVLDISPWLHLDMFARVQMPLDDRLFLHPLEADISAELVDEASVIAASHYCPVAARINVLVGPFGVVLCIYQITHRLWL